MWHESKRKAFPYVEVQQSYTIHDDETHFRRVVAMECEIWVAEDADGIVGFVAMKGDLIDQLFVRVNAQRSGVGSALLVRAKEVSPKALRAYTFRKNSPARNFFEKRGFVVVAEGVSAAPENEPDLEYVWAADGEPEAPVTAG
jgi:GNAT superfamily N-acetyltransferase